MLQQISAYAMTDTSMFTIIITSIFLVISESPLHHIKNVTASIIAPGVKHIASSSGSGIPWPKLSLAKPDLKSFAFSVIALLFASTRSKSVMATPVLRDDLIFSVDQVFKYASAYLIMVCAFFNTLYEMFD